jgi:hypothetical protein
MWHSLLRIQCGDQIVSSEALARRREFEEAMRQRNREIAARRRLSDAEMRRSSRRCSSGGLGRNTNAPLARIALEQTEMWMFRRRTGHESLLSGLRWTSLPRFC